MTPARDSTRCTVESGSSTACAAAFSFFTASITIDTDQSRCASFVATKRSITPIGIARALPMSLRGFGLSASKPPVL